MAKRVKARRVWLVDDLEENRARFVERHKAEFDVKTFGSPDSLLDAIGKEGPPDALLCDIFFYPDAAEREQVERRVEKEAKRIENLAAELRADESADGIGLIRTVRERFHNDPPFPIYAYTSKGPYLLHGGNFDRLEELDARWLFKNRCSPQIERHRISKDIAEFQERNQWTPRRMWSVAWRAGLLTAVLGSLLSVLFDRLAKMAGY
jgi:CheY-like chemotaxis protein